MMAGAGLQNEGPSLATAVLVGAGVAILEPEFIPGMLIGAGALLAPKVLPAMGNLLRPVVKGVVKAGYAATMTVREAVAEAGENVQDMVAEARAEYQTANPQHAASAPAAAATETESRRRTKKHSSPGNTGGGSPSTPML